MDTSPEYIEMCRKAKEIQTDFGRKVGDYVWDGNAVLILRYTERDCLLSSFATSGLTVLLLPSSMNSLIWLPRQDQLQEMLTKDWVELGVINTMFTLGYINRFPPNSEMTEEKFWLMCVMHEKHGKVWDCKRKDWVKV